MKKGQEDCVSRWCVYIFSSKIVLCFVFKWKRRRGGGSMTETCRVLGCHLCFTGCISILIDVCKKSVQSQCIYIFNVLKFLNIKES